MTAEQCSDELIAKQLKFCKDVLNRIKRCSKSIPFREPVDPVKLGCPDYYDKIKFPMDLSTIKMKLDSGKYSAAQDFKNDMRLMFDNCYTYNAEGSHVYNCGREVEKLYETLMAAMPTDALNKRKKVERKFLDECYRIYNEIMRSRHRKITWPFLKPVDKEMVPDYYDIIKDPMDLSTIKSRLDGGFYNSKEDFVKDLDLIITNCFTYNQENTEVSNCGVELQKMIKSLIDGDDNIKEQIVAVKNKISTLEKELFALEAKLGNCKNYTVAERVEMGKKIEELGESNSVSMLGIVNIIMKYDRSFNLDANEFEIDLKTLPNKAMKEIEVWLNSVVGINAGRTATSV